MQLLQFFASWFPVICRWIMWIILLCWFVMLALAGERAYYLFLKCDTGNRSLLNVVSKYLKTGEYEKAIKHASAVTLHLSKGIRLHSSESFKGSKGN